MPKNPTKVRSPSPSMEHNILEKIYLALEDEDPLATVPNPIVKRARKAVENMTQIIGR